MYQRFNPYERFSMESMILRDHLAQDRTILANERTLLAYIRTALAFALTGVGLPRFFQTQYILVLGFVLIAFGAFIGIFGVLRYRRIDRRVKTPVENFERAQSSENNCESNNGPKAESQMATSDN